ncbi:MAG: hypothetical protein Q8Q23_00775 [bacterium]|nr:hypothetical protein [bacterium]
MPLIIIVAIVGLANSLACYCQWRAVDISLSKTAILMQPDDLIAMGLGYWLLKETEFLNTSLITGIILCVTAAGMLICYDKKKLVGESNWRLLGWVMGYSVPWGVAYFLIRYCNLQDMTPVEWLVGWYFGSSVGASLILFYSHDGVIANGKKINVILNALSQKGKIRAKLGELLIILKNHPKFLIPLFAFCVWLAMLIGFWAGQRAPVTAYQPLYMVGQSVFRCLIGFYLFSEKEEISWGELSAFPVGILGSFIIAISLPAS